MNVFLKIWLRLDRDFLLLLWLFMVERIHVAKCCKMDCKDFTCHKIFDGFLKRSEGSDTINIKVCYNRKGSDKASIVLYYSNVKIIAFIQ